MPSTFLMFAGFSLKALKTTSKTFGKAARLSSLVKIALLTRAFSGLLNKFNDQKTSPPGPKASDTGKSR